MLGLCILPLDSFEQINFINRGLKTCRILELWGKKKEIEEKNIGIKVFSELQQLELLMTLYVLYDVC